MRNKLSWPQGLQSLRKEDKHMQNEAGYHLMWVSPGEIREASNQCSCRVRGTQVVGTKALKGRKSLEGLGR